MRQQSFWTMLATALATLITGIPGAMAADDGHGVSVQMESVQLVSWERLDDAFRYHFERDGEAFATSVGGRRYFAGQESFDDVTVRASTFGGDELGTTEILSVEPGERLVLRWNQDGFEKPFVGIRTENSRMLMELTEMPHVIGTDPDQIQVLLFGEAVEQEGRRTKWAPFEFDGSDVVEHGPFINLSLP